MESYSFKDVSFTYPKQNEKALCNIAFDIKQGEFLVLCGPSGCGKTTLLRQLKSCLAPHGTLSGEIRFKGRPLADISQREQAEQIGFVLQSPENQVVTDKVWHELAFGLESLGYDTGTIRQRVAETAAFFGIENWFYKNVADLSGGQKQLLSLASIMVMQPEVLILDEPTSQLDPIAASEFLSLIAKINRDLGTTVIMTEHRLEDVFPFADRVIVMDKGSVICDGTPYSVGLQLKKSGSGMFLAMPTAMQVWAAVETKLECPVTVQQGSRFLENRAKEAKLLSLPQRISATRSEQIALECNELWFSYEKDSPDILKGLNLKLTKGEFYALLGGNGAGKTTALKVISQLRTAYRGDIKSEGRVAYLPQSPQTLFVKKTVREDLADALKKTDKNNRQVKINKVAELCKLTKLLDRHPYDLSGGEQQRAALAKVLLTEPDILLLDEPTKGLDAEFKVVFAEILERLSVQGITILMVSHDITFCAEYAHRCGLFFDGIIVAEGTPEQFFAGNSFYTTPANRMARKLIPKAITASDIIACCGGEVTVSRKYAGEYQLSDTKITKVKTDGARSLPTWRKVVAALSVVIFASSFLHTLSISNLAELISADGISEKGIKQLWQYPILIGSLAIFAAAVRNSNDSVKEILPHVKKQKLSKRTNAALMLILLLIPATIFAGVLYLGNRYYGIISTFILIECMIPFFLVFEGRKPKARELVVIAVLCAIGVAGRSAFFMLPQFKPVMALTIISGVALGGEVGFLVGAVTMLLSNMLFSQGPWTPWQMFAMGITGFIAGVLFRKGWIKRSSTSMAAYGAFAAVVIYGGIMNAAAAIIYNSEAINAEMLLAYYISGLPMDLIHAAATVLFLLISAEPMLEKLDRIKTKYGLIE